MKKLLVLSLLMWYFGMQIQTDEPGIIVHWMQGPYKSEKECEKARQETTDLMDMMGGRYKPFKCKAVGQPI